MTTRDLAPLGRGLFSCSRLALIVRSDTPRSLGQQRSQLRISSMSFGTSGIASQYHPLGVAFGAPPESMVSELGGASWSPLLAPAKGRSVPTPRSCVRTAHAGGVQTRSPHSKHTGVPLYPVIRPSSVITTAPCFATSGSLARPSRRNHSLPQRRQRSGCPPVGGILRRSSRDTT